MDKIDFSQLLHSSDHSIQSLIEAIDSTLCTNGGFLRAIPVALNKTEVLDTGAGWAEVFSKSKYHVQKNREGVGITSFSMNYSFKERGERIEQVGSFFLLEHPTFQPAHILLSMDETNFWKKGLLPLIRSNRLNISTMTFGHSFLKDILQKMVIEWNLSDVEVTRALLYQRGANKTIPLMGWPHMGLVNAFEWANQHDGWFRSMQFTAYKQDRKVAKVFLNRRGEIKTSGGFSEIYSSLLEPVCKLMNEKYAMYGKRSRIENHGEVRPLVIDFGETQFDDVKENAHFIRALKLYKRAAITVLHGNPYIHLSVLDYFDGSNFDVWVLNPQQLFIVPQMKGTVSAIERLVGHIFEAYAEGTIKDYEDISFEQ